MNLGPPASGEEHRGDARLATLPLAAKTLCVNYRNMARIAEALRRARLPRIG